MHEKTNVNNAKFKFEVQKIFPKNSKQVRNLTSFKYLIVNINIYKLKYIWHRIKMR